MSANAVRMGASVAPTVTTAGVEGGSDQVYTFAKDVRPCFITAVEDEDIYIKINGVNATAADFDIVLATQWDTIDLSDGGRINVKSVSVYAAGGTVYDVLQLKGWTP